MVFCMFILHYKYNCVDEGTSNTFLENYTENKQYNYMSVFK